MAYINGKYQFKNGMVYPSGFTYQDFTINLDFVNNNNACTKMSFIYQYVSDNERYWEVGFLDGEDVIEVYVYSITNGVWLAQRPIIDIPFQNMEDSNFPFLLLNLQSYNNKMIINLYQMTCEKNKINKANFLTPIALLQGTLKEASSVITPSLSLNLPQFLTFNYAYIPNFNRYYFLTNLVSVKQDLWRIDLRVDVLYSFMDEILLQEALIERCEDKEYIDRMLDNGIVDEKDVDLEIIEYSNTSPINSTYNENNHLNYATILITTNDTIQ